jgi:hypothetical protein
VALATAAIEYVTPVAPGQTAVVPVIVPGAAGVAALTVTGKVLAVLVPHEFVAVTDMLPETAFPAVATVMEFVVEVPVQPDGKVHV